ncbi:MAG TPA: hypothetical protein VF898_03050 [Chloroflexota bacterium]
MSALCGGSFHTAWEAAGIPDINAQHVERHQPVLGFAREPEMGSRCRLPVGCRRRHTEVTLPIDRVQRKQPGDGRAPIEPQRRRRYGPPCILA